MCEDCLSLVEILDKQYCPFCFPPRTVFDGRICPSCKNDHFLDRLFFACSYESLIVKKLIGEFKYEPYVKDYSLTLAFLMLSHLANMNKNVSDFNGFLMIPVPLFKRKQKLRGYNQAEEIAKELSKYLKIQMMPDILIKIKSTLSQTELDKKSRADNVRNAFSVKNTDLIKNKNIILVDDVFTSGATMDECSRKLKEAGAKEVWGMAIARGS